MVDERFTRDRKEANLESLDTRERQILYRAINGEKMSELASGLFISEGTARRILTGIYIKLEIEGPGNIIQRKILLEEYGDLVKRFEKEDEFVNWVGPKQAEDIPDWVRPKPEEDFFDWINRRQEPVKTHPSVEAVTRRLRIEPTPPPPPIRTLPLRNVLVVLAVGVVLIIIAVIVWGGDRTPPAIPETTSVQESLPPVPRSPTITRLPAALNPTKTPTKTKIPTRTKTSIPTITPTPFQLPFIDEFDTGIRPEWTIRGDIPVVVNKTLSVMGVTTLSVGLRDTSLRDYIVDFKANAWAVGNQFIGIRALDEGNMIAIGVDELYNDVYIYFVQNGNWNQVQNTRIVGCTSENVHFIISVKGNRLIVTYEDPCGSTTKELYLSEPYSKYGGVMFKFPDYSVIDYIRILPNP